MKCSDIACEKQATHITQSNKGIFTGEIQYYCKKHARERSRKGYLMAKIGQKLK